MPLNKSHLPAISNPRHEDSTFAQILQRNVRNTLVPVVRNIEIYNKSKKYLTENFEDDTYLSVNVTHLTSVRVYLRDSDLKPIQFDSNDMHFKKEWVPLKFMTLNKKNGFHTCQITMNGINISKT